MKLTKISKEINLVNKNLKRLLNKKSPKNLYDASNYIIKAGGKRIRPAFCILACGASGGDISSSIAPASSVELIHTFSLVHDDIMDNDPTRRGLPTIHVKWNSDVAILVGDLLQAKAFEALLQLPGQLVPKAMDMVSSTCTILCEGQLDDMEFVTNPEKVTEKRYLDMVYKKTGCLIETSTVLGGLAAGASKKELDALAKYGQSVGIAFQIWDDYLDLTADEKDLGKPVGSDIREGKMTLIVTKILASKYKKEFLKVFGKKKASKKETMAAVKLAQDSGAIDYAKHKAEKLVGDAKKALKVLPDSDYKVLLEELADAMIARKH